MKVVHKNIVYEGQIYSYTLHIKKVKNLILKVAQDGELIVSANAYVPQTKIDAFIKEKINWILKKQEQQKVQHTIQFQDCHTQTHFYYLGKAYTIIRVQSNHNSVYLRDDHCYVYYRNDKATCNATIKKFMRKEAERIFYERVTYFFEKMKDYNFSFPQIKYRFMKTRWGSCSTNKATITLNLFLLHYSMDFIDYVVLHELSHFVQPNHSKSFYHIIENIMPNYRQYSRIPQTMKG